MTVTFVTFVTLTPDLVRSYSAAMLWKVVLMFVLLVGLSPFMGCERFQRASKEECEQTVDHLVRLEARKRGGSGLVGRGLEIVGGLAARVTGQRADAINKCMSKASRAWVRCALGADSPDEVERCKN